MKNWLLIFFGMIFIVPLIAYLDFILFGKTYLEYLYICTWEYILIIIAFLEGFAIGKLQKK